MATDYPRYHDTARRGTTIMRADDDVLARLAKACESPRRASRTGTVRQAAEILGTCTRTVERYADAGRIQRIRHSQRRIRYNMDDVDRLAYEGIDG